MILSYLPVQMLPFIVLVCPDGNEVTVHTTLNVHSTGWKAIFTRQPVSLVPGKTLFVFCLQGYLYHPPWTTPLDVCSCQTNRFSLKERHEALLFTLVTYSTKDWKFDPANSLGFSCVCVDYHKTTTCWLLHEVPLQVSLTLPMLNWDCRDLSWANYSPSAA